MKKAVRVRHGEFVQCQVSNAFPHCSTSAAGEHGLHAPVAGAVVVGRFTFSSNHSLDYGRSFSFLFYSVASTVGFEGGASSL